MVRVNIDKLKEGCIVASDVFSKTNYPIIKEKTVITNQHLHILNVFSIEEIDVEPILVNGETFIYVKQQKDDEQKIEGTEETDFSKMFLRATENYRRQFCSWQSGMNVDVTKIREIILPLIDLIEDDSDSVFSLHHYTTKENYIYQHAVSVAILSGFIAKRLKYTKGEVLQIALSGCLANCGMAKIDPKILNKKTSLTREEFNEIKKHPIYSFRMIEKTPFLKDEAKLAIYQHHERIDGSGYPLGEKGNKIHPYAKIIAVAEVYHAMTSERLYKNKRSPFKVIEMMLEDFFGQFDLVVVQKLSSAIMTYSSGSQVQLSDGRIAEIMFIDQKHPSRPLVKILDTDEIIHLVEERQLSIQRVIRK